jgi:hypothetical protein
MKMRYSLGHDLTFVILLLASAIALLSKHGFIACILFGLAIAFIYFEQDISSLIGGAK